ncbi:MULTISPECIES: pyruvate dehydrogenase complex dihydrolipoamide acetyltransferase [Sphingobium]|uniref:Acetyltransferase component of pyruvate dehydrogenase complex n=2 Tax=Sphingobium cupriresistens TaxID=1132417 RepID=A0A0J7Y257_9SPHN|nr:MULTISPECIES: pyruvate dehydrogenase complex dihydrolipoamide acetyltransferase [Sphingobium]KMS57914.1 branched-chain alpha-keto acid dehydrogenase subunit E2 [Sphingobium cupriresistens LL01]RYM12591.1 pyruvate dehydrogenase complex dihydrolipoamide acetyltransferase [Sphingobium cupriresistens]WCP15182.1 Dihydrolipoyllysine-residue acetyltransferase component of pyruvate dehydrogenase complex [Sphingobium sp. AntQ-1]
MSKTIQMPALSPTMEEGTLAKWLVKEGDTVSSGDLLAEIETDKATMEFEAVDEGVIAKILIAEGAEGVKVGTVIAIIAEEGEDAATVAAGGAKADAAPAPKADPVPAKADTASAPKADTAPKAAAAAAKPSVASDDRVKVSPLARRLAEEKGIDLASITGSGTNGRIVKADIEGAQPGAVAPSAAPAPAAAAPAPAPVAAAAQDFGIPHEVVKLSGMRKTIARRLTESKQQVPHIYLTVDIQLDKLLKLRGELNAGLESRKVKLSVNDLLIKALGVALEQVPECNVQFAGDQMLQFKRADVSVAVSIPGGLITPIITDAGGKGVAAISNAMKDLASRAKDGKLKPEEYQGGTASLSNMGMFGIKQFEAVINPPQAMIMAIGAGEKRPYIVDDSLQIATVMSATGSFDHRAIDGADGARLMKAFKELVENPIGMLA